MALDRGDQSPAQQLLAGLADAAVTVDEAGRISAWNAAAEVRLGFQGDAAAGRRPEDLAGGSLAGTVRLPMEPGGPYRELVVWPAGGIGRPDTIRLQREDAIGRLAGGISHDLANPLGAIWTFSTYLHDDPGLPADLQASARLLRDEAERTLRIVRGLLEVARHRSPGTASLALGPLVRDTVELAHSQLVTVDCRVTVPDSLPNVVADGSPLRQAVLALTLNAIEAMGGRWGTGKPEAAGRFRVWGRLADGDDARVRLSFDDSAPVVPEAHRPHLFAEDPPDGTPRAGRDLAVALALVTAAGGRLEYQALPDGNRFVVDLPVAAQPETPAGRARQRWFAPGSGLAEMAAARHANARSSTNAGLAGTILVCDDDVSIRELLVRILERAGYRTIQATGGPEALDRLAGDPVDLVIADQRMTGMTGIELYGAVAERHPDLRARFVLMSGDPGSPDLVALASDAGLVVIAKPFIDSQITTVLREAMRA